MGVTAAAVLAIGLLAGWLVDRLAGSSPTFLLIGLAVGVIGAIAFVINKFRTYLKT